MLRIALLLLLFPIGASAQSFFFGMNRPATSGITHIQSCGFQFTTSGGNTSSVSCTFPAAIGAGHFLWACVSNVGSTSLSLSWSGDAGTFTPETTNYNWQGSSGGSENTASCVYVPNTSGGGMTITASASLLSYPGLAIDEFSRPGALDQSATGPLGNSTSPASASITPTHNGDLILGFITSTGNVAVTPGSGYTKGAFASDGAGSNFGTNIYQVQTTAAAITANGSLPSTQYWFAHVAAFQ